MVNRYFTVRVFFLNFQLWFYPKNGRTILNPPTYSLHLLIQVAFVTTNGFEEKDGAMIMTVIAVANISGKALISGIGDNYPFPKIFLFDIASALGIVVMVTLLVTKQLWVLFCLAIGKVTLRCSLLRETMLLLRVSENVGPERHQRIYGTM